MLKVHMQNKMVSNKIMTAKEYADERKITLQAVYSAIKNGNKMPGVKSYRQSGKTWLLERDVTS